MSTLLDLSSEIQEQFDRVRRLAIEADNEDSEDTLSGRASAMKALTSMIETLTSSQAQLINIKRLNAIEQALIEIVKDNVSEKAYAKFLKDLEVRLGKIE